MQKKPFVSFCLLLLLCITKQTFSQAGWIPTGTDTSCTGGISYFQRIYGGNKDDFGYGIVATSDSGYIIAGRTNSYGGGNSDGLLMKITKKGAVAWSRAIGGTGDDVFYNVIRTADNGYVAIGQTKSYGNPAGDAWLVKVDNNGNLLWARKYGDGNPNGDMGWHLTQLSDGGFALCGAHRFAPAQTESFVVRTDNSGNVLWARQYSMSGNSDEAWGILEDGNSLMVVGFFVGSTFYDSYLLKLDKTTGNIIWVKSYDAENRSTQFAKIDKTNNGYQLLSIVSSDYNGTNQQQAIWNLGIDGSVTNVKKLIIPGITTSSVGWMSLADGGSVITNSENTNSADVLMTKMNSTGAIVWSKRYIKPGKQLVATLNFGAEGGYAGIGINNNAGSPVDSNDVYVLRVDTTGYAGNCTASNTNDVSISSISYSSGTISLSTAPDISLNNTQVSVSAVNFLPNQSRISCFDCVLPNPIPPVDTVCANGIAFYHKIYGGNRDDIGFDLATMSDSGYVILGQTNSDGNGGYDGLVMKYNKKGQLQWVKAIGGAGNDVFYSVRKTADDGFIACGQTKSYGNSAGDAWLVKFDGSGNIQWSKKFGDGNPDGEVAYDVTQLSDGGYALVGAHAFAPGVTQGFVVRTDLNGNALWSKQYGASGSDELWGLTEDGNNLVVTGFYSGASYYDGYILKLDKANGSIVLNRYYKVDSRSTMMAKIRKTNSGYQIFTLAGDDFVGTNQNTVIINLASDGTVLNSRKLTVTGSVTASYGWYTFPDGGFTAITSSGGSLGEIYGTQINAAGNIVWSKKYSQPGQQVIRNIALSPQGGYIGCGYNTNLPSNVDSNNVYVLRVDSLGNAGNCSGSNTADIIVNSASVSSGSSIVSDQGNVNINNPVITVGNQNLNFSYNLLCFYCQPKPTGTARPTTDGIIQHTLRIFPNPVFTGSVTVQINASYDDKVVVEVVDISGNKLATFPSREIVKGLNRFNLTLPQSAQRYSNLFLSFYFKIYTTSSQVFIMHN